MNITSQGDRVLASPGVYGSGHMDKVQVPQQISLTLYHVIASLYVVDTHVSLGDETRYVQWLSYIQRKLNQW